MVDLDRESIQFLHSELQKVQEQEKDLEKRKEELRELAIDEIEKLMDAFGLNVEDFTARKSRTTKKRKRIHYVNPNDPTQTYGGSGPAPAWYKQLRAEGKEIEKREAD